MWRLSIPTWQQQARVPMERDGPPSSCLSALKVCDAWELETGTHPLPLHRPNREPLELAPLKLLRAGIRSGGSVLWDNWQDRSSDG